MVKYIVRYGLDFAIAFATKFGDDVAAMAVKHGDEVIEGSTNV